MKFIYTRKGQAISVDDEDYEFLNKFKWFLNGQKYAIAMIDGKQKLMHRLITNAPVGLYVDHINHNTLDNRKENLRVCTQSQNMGNSRLKKNNSSGVSGVYFNKASNKWMARIKVNYKYIFLGLYANKNDAIKARKEAEERYFGEFKFQEVM